MEYLEQYNSYLEQLSTKEILEWAIDEFGLNLTLASSLGPQSIVLTDMMKNLQHQPDIFFLDTGRLPGETYDLLNECMSFFSLQYRIFFPENRDIEEYIQISGPNGFYNSVEERKQCCGIRKVKPLGRALSGYCAWMTGVRRDQNKNRSNSRIVEWDNRFDMYKINPLLNWSIDEVWNYIEKHNLPYNKLHDEGYPSVGCAPCTRAVKSGEDPRSGRWWWEENSNTECGINLVPSTEDNSKTNLVELQVPNIFERFAKEKSG